MCLAGESESGHGGRFEPCTAYIKLLSEKSRMEGRCAGLEEGNKLNLERIERQDAQLVELGAEVDRLVSRRDELLKCSEALTAKVEEYRAKNAALRKERDRLAGIVEKADALAETIDHSHDLCASMDLLRERLEELRESIPEPWRLQINVYSSAVREMANRHEAVNELYECAEYTARMDMIKAATKAYQEARHAG